MTTSPARRNRIVCKTVTALAMLVTLTGQLMAEKSAFQQLKEAAGSEAEITGVAIPDAAAYSPAGTAIESEIMPDILKLQSCPACIPEKPYETVKKMFEAGVAPTPKDLDKKAYSGRYFGLQFPSDRHGEEVNDPRPILLAGMYDDSLGNALPRKFIGKLVYMYYSYDGLEPADYFDRVSNAVEGLEDRGFFSPMHFHDGEASLESKDISGTGRNEYLFVSKIRRYGKFLVLQRTMCSFSVRITASMSSGTLEAYKSVDASPKFCQVGYGYFFKNVTPKFYDKIWHGLKKACEDL